MSLDFHLYLEGNHYRFGRKGDKHSVLVQDGFGEGDL